MSVTDALGNKTSYAYDSRNRRSRTDALGNKETYAYDGMSNLTSFTDRRGVVTNYTYDGLDRRTFAGFGAGGNAVQGTTYQSCSCYKSRKAQTPAVYILRFFGSEIHARRSYDRQS